MRHGWLAIPGVQTGDRTVEEQVLALRPAIAECSGKTVLDIGCAEGLIGREFARAGAAKVIGIDAVAGHLAVAAEQCKECPQMSFILADMNVAYQQIVIPSDIVLCLGFAHKMHDPNDAITFAADNSTNLVLIRSGRGANGEGIIKSKYRSAYCHSHTVMKERGFVLEKIVDGPPERKEPVEYWRRK